MTRIPFALVALVISGCMTSARLPLCPAIAHKSYAASEVVTDINRFAVSVAKRKDISIIQMSPFIMQVSGLRDNVKWYVESYPNMLCSFHYDQVKDAKRTFLSCMSNAPKWIHYVQTRRGAELMTDETLYQSNCAADIHG
ncbi:hypothetical protein [Sphingomonas sp. CFBP9019]|uniref:hypothetical protein n=1 Tax=Sphingomonas sp. CFBP9019 TaxID=3096532 RepID=UPI002A6A684D|nr:hypothetical protein [Sphingomonas sp. CFBP9019]MDY1010351.1 hypothetical protein [Sphingomonas sp. CFBP9019]